MHTVCFTNVFTCISALTLQAVAVVLSYAGIIKTCDGQSVKARKATKRTQ